MNHKSKIYLAGHRGLVGSAIHKKLRQEGFENIVTRTSNELNLVRQADVERFFSEKKPEYVILAAARVGGIHANITYPAQFIYENLAIQNNVIHAAYLSGVKKLLFLGSACSYPRDCLQPVKEEYLLAGMPEPTNEPYAVAKIAGIKLCEAYNRQYGTNFICAIPTNAYGPNDNFDPEASHVIPALLQRFHHAKMTNSAEVTIWGSGLPLREFIYSEDLADAILFLLRNYDGPGWINVGADKEISIGKLAFLIRDIVGFKGKTCFDVSKPDGAPIKVLDKTKISELGWKPKYALSEGLEMTYQWFLKNDQNIRSS